MPAFQRLYVGAAMGGPSGTKSAPAIVQRGGSAKNEERKSTTADLSNRAILFVRRPVYPVELALIVPKPLNWNHTDV